MDSSIGVLMTCPMSPPYLEQQLDKRYNLLRFWKFPRKAEFLKLYSQEIRAVVGNAAIGADAELIDALPRLEIVASYSVGLDKIDLVKCKERAIKVSYTPDLITDDAADLGIALILAVLRKICECDRFVRSGQWKNADFQLTSKEGQMKSGNYGLRIVALAKVEHLKKIQSDFNPVSWSDWQETQ